MYKHAGEDKNELTLNYVAEDLWLPTNKRSFVDHFLVPDKQSAQLPQDYLHIDYCTCSRQTKILVIRQHKRN